MDALALLCNLHADGPLTLRRLRREGLRSLQQIPAVPLEQLSEILEAPPSAARRFAMEAETLIQRLGREPLEPEEAGSAFPSRQPAGAPVGSIGERSRIVTRPSAPVPITPITPTGEPARPVPPTIAATGPPAAAAPFPRATPARPQPVRPIPIRPAAPAPTQWTPPGGQLPSTARGTFPPPAQPLITPGASPAAPAPIGMRGVTQGGIEEGAFLRPGLVPELDAELCERLRARGIRTLETLLASTTRSTAQAIGIPFTRLLELSYQIEGLLGPALKPATTARTTTTTRGVQAPAAFPQPTTRPVRTPGEPLISQGIRETGVGGPFA